MFEVIFKKALENGVFVVFLMFISYELKMDQKAMTQAAEARRQKGEKMLIETIEKVARQRDQKIEELIDCYNSRLRDDH